MSDFQEQPVSAGPAPETVSAEPVAAPEDVKSEALVPVEANGHSSHVDGQPMHPSWHAEAGRKGAYRIRELIRFGKLYEEEHGLKSGRQRLRQLIEEGKLYEQEHGLRPSKPRSRRLRGPRMSPHELVGTLLQSLVRLAKPSLRAELLQLLQELETRQAG